MNPEIIVIVNDFNYVQGGASKVAIDTARDLSKKGKEVYFFSAVNKEEENIDGIHYISTNQNEALKEKNRIKGIINGIYNFKARRTLKKLLKKLDKDKTIIHVHGWTKALSSSVFDVAFKMRFRVVVTLHDYFTACPNGGYFNYKKNEICNIKPLSRKCLMCNCDSRNYFFKLYRLIRQFVQNKVVKLNKKLTDVITISDFSERVLKSTLSNNTKIHRINNPIDLDLNPEKVDYKKNNYYLYVGRVSKEKGVDIFCKAITELKLNGIVVGDGPELEKIKKEYPTIEYVGWKNSADVKKYMKGAIALIVPSRWYEGAPLTPLEAMQYGIPVITNSWNATKDYIDNGKNGYIYSDYEELKSAIKVVLSNELKCGYSYKKDYAKELINCYKKIK